MLPWFSWYNKAAGGVEALFGYITVDPGLLTEEQLARWKAHYCGLCRALHERYGAVGRLTLSHDMTFLSALLGSLYTMTGDAGEDNCPVHPIKKRAWIQTRMTFYCADMNLLLAYYKAEDQARDDRSAAARAAMNAMAGYLPALEETYPRQCRALKESLDRLHSLEETPSPSPDALLDFAGQLLGEVFVPQEDAFASALRALGYHLGRFVYLCDAWEDYDADLNHRRFNPLVRLHEQADYEELISDALSSFMGAALDSFAFLPCEADGDLLRHVLLRGVWTRRDFVLQKRQKTTGTPEPCRESEDGI